MFNIVLFVRYCSVYSDSAIRCNWTGSIYFRNPTQCAMATGSYCNCLPHFIDSLLIATATIELQPQSITGSDHGSGNQQLMPTYVIDEKRSNISHVTTEYKMLCVSEMHGNDFLLNAAFEYPVFISCRIWMLPDRISTSTKMYAKMYRLVSSIHTEPLNARNENCKEWKMQGNNCIIAGVGKCKE